MKKFFIFAVVALCLSSCKTSLQTSSQHAVSTAVVASAQADIQVGKKITYTYVPTSAVRRGGFKNVKSTAIAEALKANGGGDVLIESQEATVVRTGLFGSKVKSITVTGYVGTYTNFRKAEAGTVKKAATTPNVKLNPSVLF